MIAPTGAYMLCQHCAAHGIPQPGVDWIAAFREFLKRHAECGQGKPRGVA